MFQKFMMSVQKKKYFERLKRDGVFDEEPPKNSPIIKKKTKIMPWLIAACAALFELSQYHL